MAPPPNPMMAMPVAMPRRSGNHFINVETGEIYPSPSPTPPITPPPSHISQSWCRYTPSAVSAKPPGQHTAATTPARRGPTRSSHPPHSAAEAPSTTIPSVKIGFRLLSVQSQSVAVSTNSVELPAGHATACVTPTAWLSGSQNTESP